MASRTAVAGVLAYLHELYPSREITATTAEAWIVTFSDWGDEELETCARNAAATPGRTFFPTPGEIAAFHAVPSIDAAKMLRQISALGTHNPVRGWLYPRIETVRAAFGDGVATAYAAAGAERCFADDDSVTQDIARRAFATELSAAQKKQPSSLLLATPSTKLLTGVLQ